MGDTASHVRKRYSTSCTPHVTQTQVTLHRRVNIQCKHLSKVETYSEIDRSTEASFVGVFELLGANIPIAVMRIFLQSIGSLASQSAFKTIKS